jgi:hypothetical protein
MTTTNYIALGLIAAPFLAFTVLRRATPDGIAWNGAAYAVLVGPVLVGVGLGMLFGWI